MAPILSFPSLALLTVVFTTLVRADILCGLVGYDLGVKAYNYANGTEFATATACGARCHDDSTCVSFAVGSDSCLLYALTVYVSLLLLADEQCDGLES